MNIKQFRGGLRFLAVVVVGLWVSPVRADIIAEDAFNYIPQSANLSGANGGSGWYDPLVETVPATVAPGLTYTIPTLPQIGLGNSALVGNSLGDGGLSRGIGDHVAPATYWIRAFYSPGTTDPTPDDTVTPFLFQGINSSSGGYFSLDRTEGATSLNMNLNMVLADGSGGSVDTPVNFTLGAGTHMLLWELTVDQTPGANETLQMWLDPTAAVAGDLGEPVADMQGDILGNDGTYDDFLGYFSSTGVGDIIDEIVIGSSFADAISQLNDPITSVPEVSGPVMMLLATPLAVGAIWYRRRQRARV